MPRRGSDRDALLVGGQPRLRHDHGRQHVGRAGIALHEELAPQRQVLEEQAPLGLSGHGVREAEVVARVNLDAVSLTIIDVVERAIEELAALH